MPPEWAAHSRTMMVYPDAGTVPDGDLALARREVSAIANAISRFEPVCLYTRPEHVEAARKTVHGNVSVVGLEEARHLWVRDTGPVLVKESRVGGLAGLGMNFNYWGSKASRIGDELLAEKVLADMELPLNVCSFRAEGGAIEVDGDSTLLATASSIANSNRNPGMDRAQLEQCFLEVFGVEKTIWLEGVVGYEMTDYHIDALARFVKPGTVLLSKPAQSAERVSHDAYEEAKEVLSQETDARGRRLRVVDVQEPELEELPGSAFGETVASYVNYLVVNGGIVMPRFGAKMDDAALAIVEECFPGREVVRVHLNALPNNGGGIHCATQQVPAEDE